MWVEFAFRVGGRSAVGSESERAGPRERLVNVLVLAGTGEGRRLAAALVGRPGIAVTSSLAGAVARPALPPGAVRIGGFGGVPGLTAWLRDHRIDVLVDATHPFAATITGHAVAATHALGMPLLVLRRPGWTAGPGDLWHRVPSAAAAASLIPTVGERAFLATGRGDLGAFASLACWCLVRAVDPPPPPLPRRHRVVLARGPFAVEDERALLREHRIDVVVARDSGGQMAAAKLVAARERGTPVVLLDRPSPPAAPTVATVDAALARLDDLAGPTPGRLTRPHPARRE